VSESLSWDAEQLRAGFDAQQRLHAAWVSFDYSAPTLTVFHAVWDSAAWSAPQMKTVDNGYSSKLAMVLDDQSNAHIALISPDGSGNQLLLYLTATDAAMWIDNSTPLEDPSSEVYDMKLDAAGNPHVLLGGQVAHYAMRAGGTWQVVDLNEQSDNGVLAIDSDYNITVAVGWVAMDWGFPEGASSLRHSAGGWAREDMLNTSTVMYALGLDANDQPILLCDSSFGLSLMILAP
jgi:hypothetical protein